jgi:phosphatidylglycerophosphatase GEP4
MANRMKSPGWMEHVQSFVGSLRSPKTNEKVATQAVGSTQSMTTHGPLAIWTTGVWKREAMAMRFAEKTLLEAVQKWVKPPRDSQEIDTRRFIRELPPPPPPPKVGLLQKLMARIRFG